MIKIFCGAIFSLMFAVSAPVFADPTADAPPAHKQKKNLPDTTSSGDYLESQDQSVKDHKHQKQGATPSNAPQKSERFKQEPEEGGTEVKQK